MRTVSLLAMLVFTALAFAACDAAPPSDGRSTAGLFDESPLLPALTATDAGFWQWVSMPGMRCRDSTETGFGIRRSAGSDELLIVLQAGGACFNAETCASNRSDFDVSDFVNFVASEGREGIYNVRPDNPFRDWNVVFVPHCTGDLHVGDSTDVAVEGVEGLQQFVGHRNMRAMLARIENVARNATQVVLTGAGFAATGSYGLVAERLAPAPVHLIADAGPLPPDDDVLTPELQTRMRGLWNLDTMIPAGCLECSKPNGDGLDNLLLYYTANNPERAFGLISYRSDRTNRGFFGYDNPNCTSNQSMCHVPARDFQDGLRNIRALLEPYPNGGTYYIPGNGHTSLDKNDFFNVSVDSVALTQWMVDALDGTVEHIPRDTL